MMLALTDEDCKISDAVKAHHDGISSITDAERISLALGEKYYDGSAIQAWATVTGKTETEAKDIIKYMDFDYIKCKKGKGNSMSDLLPLMMMGGMNGQVDANGQPINNMMNGNMMNGNMMNNPLMMMA